MGQEEQKIKVVVFDLNGTFYNKSSKEEFYKFICSKKPNRVRYIFEMSYFYLQLKLNFIRQTEFKENFFNYLDELPPEQVTLYATEFWEREFPQQFNSKLMERFQNVKLQEDVLLFCATGGLEVYVKPLFDLYEVDGFVGTRVIYNGHTYEGSGPACKGEEKLKRLEEYLDGQPYRIIEAYSNSREEILDKAERAYLVKDGEIYPYN